MIEQELTKLYSQFLSKLGGIDSTGILNKYPTVRFPTYPFIGSNYGKNKKILFIGLDVGSDETHNVQDFSERNASIELRELSKHNPHIAGTYICALYFLSESKGWGSFWNKVKTLRSSQKAIRNKDNLPNENPLSFVALTNFYKFVKIGRENRSGGADRHYKDKGLEMDMLIREVNIFNPDIIVFQGKQFLNKAYLGLVSSLENLNRVIIIGPHPSYRGRKDPEYFLNQFVSIPDMERIKS